ncbi:hypothetical protein CQW23_34998 [Capsicum baccatum]|uniref:Uncharacterized protein n=1 Tax=Capsicum baccatum TaxID=33114 RepID=A0A2G2UXA2_CAPBA|nr:hypothetical protein CQW23_34998 [Capsicum baccatum]
MPKISNAAIFTITSAAKALTDLSIGFCDEVTDAAVQMLMERPNHISTQLIVAKRENLHAICKVQPRLVCAVLVANLGAVMARNGTRSDD